MRNINTYTLHNIFIFWILFFSLGVNKDILIDINLSSINLLVEAISTIILVYFFNILLFSKKYHKKIYKNTFELLILFCLILWCCISSMWAENVSITQYILLVLTTIFSVYIYEYIDYNRFFNILSNVILVVGVISMLISIFNPEIGTDDNGIWNGIFNQKNTFARIMGVGIILYYFRFKYNEKRTPICIIAIVIMFINMFFSKCNTSIIITIFIILIDNVCKINKNTLKYVFICFFITSIILVTNNNVFGNIGVYLGKDMTFTGRTYIWDFTIEEIMKKPFIGYGYNQVLNNQPLFVGHSWEMVKQPHNGILNILFQLGIIGGILYFFMIVKAIYCSQDRNNKKLIIIIIFIIINNLMESLTISTFSIFWIIQILFILRYEDETIII